MFERAVQESVWPLTVLYGVRNTTNQYFVPVNNKTSGFSVYEGHLENILPITEAHNNYIDPQNTFVARMPMAPCITPSENAFGLIDGWRLQSDSSWWKHRLPRNWTCRRVYASGERPSTHLLTVQQRWSTKVLASKTAEETHAPLLTQDVDHVVHLIYVQRQTRHLQFGPDP